MVPQDVPVAKLMAAATRKVRRGMAHMGIRADTMERIKSAVFRSVQTRLKLQASVRISTAIIIDLMPSSQLSNTSETVRRRARRDNTAAVKQPAAEPQISAAKLSDFEKIARSSHWPE